MVYAMTQDKFSFVPPTSEPSWLTSFRQEGWKKYLASRWENMDVESWRYVKPADFLKLYAQEPDTSCVAAETFSKELFEKVIQLSRSYSTQDKFSHLHQALFDQGTWIHIPAGRIMDTPIDIIPHITDQKNIPFVVVVLGRASQARIVEHMTHDGQAAMVHSRVIVLLEEGASLEYISLLQLKETTASLHQHTFFLESGATLQATYLPLGSCLSRVVQDVHVIGQHAVAKTNGFIFGHQDQKFDFHSYQHHHGPSSESELFFRNVVTDAAKAIFIGNVYIAQAARGTKAYQTNKNLILSDHAEAIAIPKLEIDTEDVMCGHGVAVSSLSEDELFYLQSRGIQKPEAKRMIIQGFYGAVVDRIPSQKLRDHVNAVLEKRLTEIAL